jgi:hypothetical protein
MEHDILPNDIQYCGIRHCSIQFNNIHQNIKPNDAQHNAINIKTSGIMTFRIATPGNTTGESITVLFDWFGISLFLFAKQINPNQSNRRSMVQ